METPITKESLIEFGMIEPKDEERFIYPLLKRLDEEREEGGLYLAISNTQNSNQLALVLPDGSELFLACETIEQLKTIEGCIHFYSSNY